MLPAPSPTPLPSASPDPRSTSCPAKTAPPPARDHPPAAFGFPARRQGGPPAFEGPSGSGRTLTSLLVASALGDPIAVIDTTGGTAAKYADTVPFNTLELTHFNPERLFTALAVAAMRAYPVLIVDRHSAFWNGSGGILDKVADETRSGYGSSNAGWNRYRPMDRRVTAALSAYPGHVILTLNSRTTPSLTPTPRGASTPSVSVSAPEQRSDLDYDLDAVGTLGPVATVRFGKSRIPPLTGQVIEQPGEDLGRTIAQWASEGVPNWPQASFIERARDPKAAFDSLGQLRAEALASRAGAMAVLDLHCEPTTLDALIVKRGRELAPAHDGPPSRREAHPPHSSPSGSRAPPGHVPWSLSLGLHPPYHCLGNDCRSPPGRSRTLLGMRKSPPGERTLRSPEDREE
ncbi:AAA family ATPase [Streptomyces sp. NPDC044780]|uniref:AAA family ATPase n=1 Tax=unclassified Streptomyces TaxID=2593676 RepID=UPI00340EDC0F